MKKFLLLLTIFICSLTVKAQVQSVVYLQSNTAPNNYWNLPGNQDALNAVYGAGNYSSFPIETINPLAIFIPSVKFIFIDGSNSGACAFITFLKANNIALENWVAAGGSLFLNAAPTSCNSSAISVYFGGISLTSSSSFKGYIINTNHPIFKSGTSQPSISNVYTGDQLALSNVSGTGLTTILKDEKSLPILSEKSYGKGRVIFGGLTLAFINKDALWGPEPNLFNFYKNLLEYLQKPTLIATTVSSTVFCAGTSLTASYTLTGTYTSGNKFTAQLSDASGSFTSPTTIGSLTSIAKGTISVTIPVGTPAGSAYRIRVVSSTPLIYGSNNGSNITISASTLPIMVAPADLTVACGGGLPTATKLNFTNGLSGACVLRGTSNTPTFSTTPTACGGTVTETWTATDVYQRAIAPVSRKIIFSPATLPTMTAPAAITVACGALPASSTRAYTNGLSGSCLLSGTSNASTFSIIPGALGGPVTETWTATDVCGRVITSVSRIIIVKASALAVMTAPSALTVACGAIPAASQLSFSNALSGTCLVSGKSNLSTITTVPSALGGTVTETWTATDNVGRILTPVSRKVTVTAAALPIMTAPAATTVACGGVPVASKLPFSNVLSGTCLVAGTSNASTITSIPSALGGTVTETWTATDNVGRILAPVTRIITVTATTLSTMTAPAAITVACGAVPTSTTLLFSNGLSGTCLVSGKSDGSTITAIPTAQGGTVTETWTATDNFGRALAPVTRIITVTATALPIMTAPAAITVACGGIPASTKIVFSNNLTGTCMVTGVSNASTLTTIPAALGGTVTETWTATDNLGRPMATVSRIITVSATTLPIMTALADIKVSNGNTPAASTIAFSNNLTGSCLISGTSNPSTFSPAPGANGGTVTETWTATDNAGRPLAPVSRTITVAAAATSVYTLLAPDPYTISCGYVPAVSRISFGNFGNGNYQIVGTSDLSTMTATPGVAGGIITETWTGKDNSGNTIAPVTRILTVSAAKLPFMNAPAGITVANSSLPAASSLSFSNYSDGSCLISGTSNISTLSGTVGTNGGTITETWTATDIAGRTLAPVSRTITVSALTIITLLAPDPYTISCGYTPAFSRINFGNFSGGNYLVMGTSDLSTMTAIPGVAGGIITETWTGKDNNGNTLIPVSRILTVTAGKLPFMHAPGDTMVNNNNKPVAQTISYSNYSDGSCLISGTSNPSTFSGTTDMNGGIITETFTATDLAGRPLVAVSRKITVNTALQALSSITNKGAALNNAFKVSAENKLSVYPNPTRGIINLVLTGDASKVTSVEVVDLLGKIIYSSKHYQSIINLSNKSAGIYIVRVHSNAAITTTKIIMED